MSTQTTSHEIPSATASTAVSTTSDPVAETPVKRTRKSPADKKAAQRKYTKSRETAPGRGNVRRLPSGKYRPRLRHRGKNVRFVPSLFDTPQEAAKAIDDYLSDTTADTSKAKRRAKGQQVLEDVIAKVITERESSGVSPATLADLRDLTKNVIANPHYGIGKLRLVDLTERDGKDWMRDAERAGQGASRRIKALGLVCSITAKAARKRWIEEDPFIDVRAVPRGRRRASTRKEKFFLDPAEVVALTTASSTRRDARLMLEVHLWSGMRPGEVRGMDGITVDPTRPGWLNIEQQVDESGPVMDVGPTKMRESRYVQVPTPVWRRLVALTEARGALGQPLFPADRGGWLRYATWHRQAWAPALAAAAEQHPALLGDPTSRVRGRRVPPTPYAMRATVVSVLLAAGAAHPDVQRQVGHAHNSVVTDVYTMQQMPATVYWPQADAVRGTGLDLQGTLDALYDAVWAQHGPPGGRDALGD